MGKIAVYYWTGIVAGGKVVRSRFSSSCLQLHSLAGKLRKCCFLSPILRCGTGKEQAYALSVLIGLIFSFSCVIVYTLPRDVIAALKKSACETLANGTSSA